MNELGFWLKLVLAVLATWRVTHLLANEDGPAELLARLRAQLGTRTLGRLMDCFECLSLWVAAPMALFVTRRPLELLLTWLALSGAACLLERVGQEPVVIQSMSRVTEESGDSTNGMLRAETSGSQERTGAGNKAGGGAHGRRW